MQSLEISVKEDKGNAVISITGEVDYASASKLKQAVQESLEWCRDTITFDMSEVDYIDSEGIRVILMADRELRCRGGKVLVRGCNRVVERVFELLGLERYCLR